MNKTISKDFNIKLHTALKQGSAEDFTNAFIEFADQLQQNIIADAHAAAGDDGKPHPQQKNTRVLTGAEQLFYEKTIKAMKSANPRQELANIEITMPESILDCVFEHIRQEHPLLACIDFRNTMGKIKMFVNKTDVQLAYWGEITAEIAKEISASIGEVDTGLKKLTAFLPVSKSMLDLGAVYLDRYVRELLSEVISVSLENAIINGDGNNQPIGMIRNVSDGVSVSGGVYPEKEAAPITDLTVTTLGSLLAQLTQAPNGKIRAVKDVIFIVNPKNYFEKIMQWTTIQLPTGIYANDILPVPNIKIIPSAAVEQGKSIFGLGKRYFAGVGSDKNGRIEYDDSVRFLEDERVYAVRLYANGMPLDNNAFLYLDISGMTEPVTKIQIVE